jgi:D-alanine-D-alanine ligase
MINKVALLFGGYSPEHQVSIRSAKRVYQALREGGFQVVLVYINRENGSWNIVTNFERLTDYNPVSLVPGQSGHLRANKKEDSVVVDVVFPVLHGPYGEDGTLQGLLSMSQTPYVGADTLSSAISMDKEITKRLLRDNGFNVGKFLVFKKKPTFKEVQQELGLPFFVKPVSLGSSIGINKVVDEKMFLKAIDSAFDYSDKIIIEGYNEGREIECAVIGDKDSVEASPLGEIIPHYDFYSYEAKYSSRSSAELKIPADLPTDLAKKIQKTACEVFKTLGVSGLARIDFYINKDEIIVGEINTLPGFTSISMFPRLWEEAGLSFSELTKRLIILAKERYNNEKSKQKK